MEEEEREGGARGMVVLAPEEKRKGWMVRLLVAPQGIVQSL